MSFAKQHYEAKAAHYEERRERAASKFMKARNGERAAEWWAKVERYEQRERELEALESIAAALSSIAVNLSAKAKMAAAAVPAPAPTPAAPAPAPPAAPVPPAAGSPPLPPETAPGLRAAEKR